MQIKRQEYIKEISDKLYELKEKIRGYNACDLFDNNRYIEEVICGVLNIVYGYKLVNLNRKIKNHPYIDLGDEVNKIAVQVTSECSRRKIETTISAFAQNQYDKYYERLIFFILGDKIIFRKDFSTNCKLNFSKNKDVIDISQVRKDLNYCNDEEIYELYNFLQEKITWNEKDFKQYIRFVTDPPTNQSQFYSNREDEENELLSWIKSGEDLYIIRGTGGIGKTEIAKAIWKKMTKYGNEYGINYLAWVPYQASDLRLSICRAFLMVKTINNIDVAWEKVCKFFMDNQQQILIFIDNIEKVTRDDLLLWRIGQYPIKVIITTREKLDIGIKDVELRVLSKDNCKNLFYKIYDIEKNDEIVLDILKKAGYLTVAIELLAKTAMKERKGLRQLNEDLINLEFDISEEDVSSNHDLLRKEDKIAEQLKKLFCISNYDSHQIYLLINISMFPATEFSYEDAKNWFGETRRTPFDKLVDWGWLKLQENSHNEFRYWMHPVLAASIRLQTIEILHESCKKLINNFTKILITKDENNLLARFSIITYASSLILYQRNLLCELEDINFLVAVANVYVEIGEYVKAIEIYELALKISKNNGYGYETNMEIYRLLANSYKQRGNFMKATNIYDKLLVEVEKNKKVENVILLYRDMGHMYKSKGDYIVALYFYNRAEKIYKRERKKHNALDVKYLAMLYYGKGNLYRCAENYSESIKFYRRARSIYKKIVDETNPEWMLIHSNIGVCHMGLGNLKKALEYHQEALRLQSRTYRDKTQPFMGLSYMYRGDTYTKMGDYSKAYSDYENALRIISNSVGSNHPYMVRIENHIARLYMLQREYQTAEEEMLKMLPFEQTELGNIHPDTAELYNNLVEIYCALGNQEKAREFHLKIKKYTDTVLHNHPETLKLWMREAEFYEKKNNIQLAQKSLKKIKREVSEIIKEAPVIIQADNMLNRIQNHL